jgi:hypothetical protein
MIVFTGDMLEDAKLVEHFEFTPDMFSVRYDEKCEFVYVKVLPKCVAEIQEGLWRDDAKHDKEYMTLEKKFYHFVRPFKIEMAVEWFEKNYGRFLKEHFSYVRGRYIDNFLRLRFGSPTGALAELCDTAQIEEHRQVLKAYKSALLHLQMLESNLESTACARLVHCINENVKCQEIRDQLLHATKHKHILGKGKSLLGYVPYDFGEEGE